MRKGLLMLLIFVPFVVAASSQVLILDLKYKDGNILFNDKIIKQGYSPDRLFAEGDYYGTIISLSGEELYNFRFDVPLVEFLDLVNDSGELSGGIVVYNETDFALVLPYFDDTKEIKIFSDNNLLLDVNIADRPVLQEDYFGIGMSLFASLVLIILIIVLLRKRRAKTI